MDSKDVHNDSIETLATFYGVSDTNLLESLDPDLVERLASKIPEFDKVTSSVSILEEKLEELNREKQGYEGTIGGLQTKLTESNNRVTTLSDELSSLERDLKSTKDGKAEAVKLLDLKLSELDRLQSKLQGTLNVDNNLRAKNVSLNEQLQVLKLENLSLKTDVETTKQSLTYSEMQKSWLERELDTQKGEFDKYREKKEKEFHEQYTSLAKVTQELESTKTAYNVALANNDELSTNARKRRGKLEALRHTLDSEREAAKRDKAAQDNLITLLEKQVKEQQKSLDKVFAVQTGTETSEKNKEELLGKIEELTQNLDKVLAENKVLENKLTAYERVKSTETALDLEKQNKADDSNIKLVNNVAYTQLSDEISHLRKQLLNEQTEKGQLETQVKSLISELEQKIPLFNSLRERADYLERELEETSLLLEHTSNENLHKAQELDERQQETNTLREQVQGLDTQCTHLAEQVQFLLYNIECITQSHPSKGVPQLTKDEINTVRLILRHKGSEDKDNNKLDSQEVISDRLVKFKNVVELQMQNMNLLKAIEALTARAEELEVSKKESEASVEAVTEAKEAILTLKEYNSKLEAKVESLTEELKTYTTQRTPERPRENGVPQDTEGRNDMLIKTLRDKLDETIAESRQNSKLLNDEIDKLHESQTKLTFDYETEKSGRKLAEERLELLQSTYEISKRENTQLQSRIDNLVNKISEQDSSMSSITQKYLECNSKLSVMEYSIESLKSEKQLSLDAEQFLKEELKKVSQERNNLKLMVTQLQSLQGERESLVRNVQDSCDAEINRFKSALEDANERLESKSRELNQAEEDRKSQIKWYKETIDSLQEKNSRLDQQLKQKSEELERLDVQSEELRQKLQEMDQQVESYKLSEDAKNARNKILSLEKELADSRDSLADCYSQIEVFTQQAATNQTTVQRLTNELQQAMKQGKELEEANGTLEDKLIKLNIQFEKDKDEFERERIDLNRKLSVLDFSERNMEKVRAEFEDRVKQLQSDLEHQATLAIESQRKYQQEFQRCMEMSEDLSKLRNELQGYKGEVESTKAQYKHTKHLLEQQRDEFSKEKETYIKKFELVSRRVEDLSSQNKILYEQLDLLGNKSSAGEKDTDSSINKLEKDLINNLRRERDILNAKLSIHEQEVTSTRHSLSAKETELRTVKLELANLKNLTLEKETQEAGRKVDISNQLDVFKESNITLRNELKEANKKVGKLTADFTSLQEKYIPLKSELEHIKSSIEERNKQLQLARDECNRWRNRSDELLQSRDKGDPEANKKLKEEINSLRSELEDQKKKTQGAETRFQKLKDQAHERLDAAERTNRALTDELNGIKVAKDSLQTVLDGAQRQISHLEDLVEQGKHMEAEKIKSLEEELSATKAKSSELEHKLDASLKSSGKLESEIERLQNRLQTSGSADSSPEEEEASSLVASLRQELDLERARYKLLQEEAAKHVAGPEGEMHQEGDTVKHTSDQTANSTEMPQVDMEALKKQWMQEHEEDVQQRIKEAEENLKRRIRLPTEEKINRIIEKKRAALQEEYDKNLEEKAKDLLMNTEAADLPLKIKEAIENNYKTKFEKELQETRKKSFEEGKHQASMRLALLEKKIALLEGQTKHVRQAERPQTSKDTSVSSEKSVPQVNEDSAAQAAVSTVSDGTSNPKVGSKASTFGSPHFSSAKPNLFFQGANTLGSRGAYNPFTSSLKATPVPTPHILPPSSPKGLGVQQDVKTPTKPSEEESKEESERSEDSAKRPAETELPGDDLKKSKNEDTREAAVTTDDKTTSS